MDRRVGLAVLLAALGGCAPGGVAPRAAAPDDLCGPQVVVFVSAGDLFGSPPRRQGPPTVAEMAAELTRENAAIERLQIAFDALLYCRWTEVRVIRADAASGAFPAPELPNRLAAAQGRLRQDLSRANQIRSEMAARAARIEASVEAAAPGTRAARVRDPSASGARAVASAALALRLRPEAAAPETGRLNAGQQVTLRPAPGGFAFVDAGGGLTGYAANNAFTLIPAPVAAAAPGEASDIAQLRSLAATNLARRDNFTQTVALADRSGGDAFERAL